MRLRGADDAEISSTRNCTQNKFAVRSGMSPAKKLPKLLGAREGDIRVFLDSLAKLETGVAIIFEI